MSEPELIAVMLTAPDEIVWEGQATTVTAENSEGLFDLYPDHARFMTLLEGTDLIIRPPEGPELTFHIEKAILFFQGADLRVYLHKHVDAQPK